MRNLRGIKKAFIQIYTINNLEKNKIICDKYPIVDEYDTVSNYLLYLYAIYLI